MSKKANIILLVVTLAVLAAITTWSLIHRKVEVPEPVIVEPAEVEVVKPPVNTLLLEHIFNVKEKKQEFNNVTNIQKKYGLYYFKSVVSKKGEKDIVVEAKLNQDFETLEWKEKNPKKNLNVVAIRQKNKIILTGTFDNKKDNKREIYIDDRKWQQIYQLGMMKFAAKENIGKSIEFWSLNPDEPWNAMVIAANKESLETITLNGKKVKTVRLRICLAGLLSPFWTGDYWYRLSDGFFVRAKISGDLFVELKEGKKEIKVASKKP